MNIGKEVKKILGVFKPFTEIGEFTVKLIKWTMEKVQGLKSVGKIGTSLFNVLMSLLTMLLKLTNWVIDNFNESYYFVPILIIMTYMIRILGRYNQNSYMTNLSYDINELKNSLGK